MFKRTLESKWCELCKVSKSFIGHFLCLCIKLVEAAGARWWIFSPNSVFYKLKQIIKR